MKLSAKGRAIREQVGYNRKGPQANGQLILVEVISTTGDHVAYTYPGRMVSFIRGGDLFINFFSKLGIDLMPGCF